MQIVGSKNGRSVTRIFHFPPSAPCATHHPNTRSLSPLVVSAPCLTEESRFGLPNTFHPPQNRTNSQTALLFVPDARIDLPCFLAPGGTRYSPPSSPRGRLRSTSHVDGRTLLPSGFTPLVLCFQCGGGGLLLREHPRRSGAIDSILVSLKFCYRCEEGGVR